MAFVVVLFLLLLCLMPPDGLLTDNEEDYFELAERFATGAATPDSAVFDSSPHRALNDVLLGVVIIAIGYERAQIIARLTLIAAFSILAMCVFRTIWPGADRRSDRARRLRSPPAADHGSR
jgi:hypothetical protein